MESKLKIIEEKIAECTKDGNISGFYGYVNFDDVIWLVENLKKSVDALKFYEEWDNYHYPANVETSLTPIDLDIGVIARKVLED